MIQTMAKIGFYSRAIVYFATGLLALTSSLGLSNQKEHDLQYSINFISKIPLGKFFIILIGLGLLSYGIWKFFQGYMDIDELGKKPGALFIRFTYYINGMIHVSLAYFCYRTVLRLRVQDQDQNVRDWVKHLMNIDLGRYIVGIIGLSFIGFAISEVVKAYLKKYERGFHLKRSHPLLHFIARFGMMGRAVIFFIIGGLMLKSSWHFRPEYAGGFGNAWYVLLHLDYGTLLAFIISAGLMAYGFYTAMLANLREI